LVDSNAVVRAHLAADAGIIALVGTSIYCPRLPEGASLPAIGLFTRGGTSTPYIPGMPNPSVQIDCWADDPVDAREIYRAVYDSLQGIQNVIVGTIALGTDGYDYHCILEHTAAAASRPITGADYATYWVKAPGTGNGSTWVSGTVYPLTGRILSAIEEVQGQDLVDSDIPNYFRVLSFWSIMIR